MSITTNFFGDVREDFEALLRALDVNLPDTSGEAHVNGKVRLLATEYFHQIRRRIPMLPRQVLWSRELLSRQWSQDERKAVDAIAAEVTRGDDLTPRLSRAIRKSVSETVVDRSYDGLLTDWGIHHLHLGETIESDGFVERSRCLLFVFIKGTTAYLVDVLEHRGSFTNHQLFQSIHENWPDVIAEWRMQGVIPGSLSPSYEPKARQQMRSKFVVGTAANDGTPYVPPGGGVMLSGHSIDAADQACRLLNMVHPAEVWVRANDDVLRDAIMRNVGSSPEVLGMRFETRAAMACGHAVISEVQTAMRFLGIPPDSGGIVRVGVPPHVPSRRVASE
jgi:hypothetical protein